MTYLITGGGLTPQNFQHQSTHLLQKLEIAVAAEVSMIQIREKQLPARLVAELASAVIRIAGDSQTKILINDRADLALAVGADGVHLTASSIPTEIIRHNFPTNFVIGVSTHSPEEVLRAKCREADFAVLSPIFPTTSKINYGAPQGVEKLKKVVEEVKGFPVIALGGIDEDNFVKTLEVGASGVAGISLFNDSEKLLTVIGKINNWRTKNE